MNEIRKLHSHLPTIAGRKKNENTELWTTVSGPGETKEVWATVIVNGPDKGWPCAFGPKDKMESYLRS